MVRNKCSPQYGSACKGALSWNARAKGAVCACWGVAGKLNPVAVCLLDPGATTGAQAETTEPRAKSPFTRREEEPLNNGRKPPKPFFKHNGPF